MTASGKSQLSCVKVLLAAGAAVNMQNKVLSFCKIPCEPYGYVLPAAIVRTAPQRSRTRRSATTLRSSTPYCKPVPTFTTAIM
jgi:hypothetical protein